MGKNYGPIIKTSTAQKDIDLLTFLSSSEWHIENYKGKEILVVAEEIPKHNGSICLVIDLDGKAYGAISPMY